jgi:dephospho-CoA kinase
MQKNQAIFIIGAPGSGKDVVIRDITSNYNIVEFASTQIDEMLSNDAAFKRALSEKQESLLDRHSIVVTANSFNLNFAITKQILESIGYSSHLILVEADLAVSIERLKTRNNLKESLDRITTGNVNKTSILGLFESYIIVDNSKALDLSETRTYILDILSELSFKSDLTLEDITKSKIKKKLKSIVPSDVTDTRGMTPGSWSVYNGVSESYEVFSFDTSLIATSPMQKISSSIPDMRSDNDKERTRKVLGKIKKINFKKVVPYGIG